MSDVLDLRWTSLFADVPADSFDRAVAFWAEITGWPAGRPAGDRGEYVPLQPPDGDPYLWLQRVDRAVGGWHLDLHVPEVGVARDVARSLGARVVREVDELTTLSTPGGQPFCLVAETRDEWRRPAVPAWPGGQHSIVDQLCLDIEAADFDGEASFWTALTGWSRRDGALAEFDNLDPPVSLPIKVLLQRLGTDDGGGTRAHADLACDARPVEVARHVALGATAGSEGAGWTVMIDPVGLTYCITDHAPH